MVKEKYCPYCRYPKFRTNNLSINNCHWCNSLLVIREVIGRDILMIGIFCLVVGIFVGIFMVQNNMRIPWERI